VNHPLLLVYLQISTLYLQHKYLPTRGRDWFYISSKSARRNRDGRAFESHRLHNLYRLSVQTVHTYVDLYVFAVSEIPPSGGIFFRD